MPLPLVTTAGFLMGMLIPKLAVSIFTTHEELVRYFCQRTCESS